MRMRWILSCAVVGAVVIGGCGKNETAPAGGANSGGAAAAPAAPATPATPAIPAIPAAAGDAAASVQTQADGLITQATEYIKNNKMDLADKTVTQLEGLKPKLPAEYGPRIDQLRAAFNSAKTAGGMKMPEGIKLPG